MVPTAPNQSKVRFAPKTGNEKRARRATANRILNVRHIALNADGITLFKAASVGKRGGELDITKTDETPWGKHHHVRALQHACAVTNIQPAIAFHEQRHTYASHLAQAGVDLLMIAKLLSHAVARTTAKHYAHLADKPSRTPWRRFQVSAGRRRAMSAQSAE